VQDKAEIFQKEAVSAFTFLGSKKVKADIVYMDPPYDLHIISELIAQISKEGLLSEDGLIIAEHDQSVELEEQIQNYTKVDKRVYGTTIMSYYRDLS